MYISRCWIQQELLGHACFKVPDMHVSRYWIQPELLDMHVSRCWACMFQGTGYKNNYWTCIFQATQYDSYESLKHHKRWEHELCQISGPQHYSKRLHLFTEHFIMTKLWRRSSGHCFSHCAQVHQVLVWVPEARYMFTSLYTSTILFFELQNFVCLSAGALFSVCCGTHLQHGEELWIWLIRQVVVLK